MKKYAFRLETVRRVRRTQEDLAKSALIQANSEVQRAIAAVEARATQYEHSITSNPSGVVGVEGFMKQRYFNELSGQAVVAARASQATAELEAAARRDAWSEAAQKVKVLDRLDQRRREDYRVEYAREVEKEIDDIVVGRAGKRNSR